MDSVRTKLGWSLLCLTSTRHRRFVEDIVALNALPIGARWRFRYLEKYVDPAMHVLADTPQGAGIDVLLGICSFEDPPYPEHAGPAYGRHLDVLRCATTISVRRTGELLVIDFELGGFVSDTDAADLAPSDVRKKLPERSDAGAPQGWFCAVLPAQTAVRRSTTVEGWERAANTTLKRTSADLVPFAFGIVLEGGRKARLRKGQLKLQAGEHASLDIHTLARQCNAPRPYKRAIGEIKLNISVSTFNFTSSSTVRIDTHRNVKTVTLQSAPAFKESVGHISILAFSFRAPIDAIQDGPAQPDQSTALAQQKADTSADREDKRPALVRLDLATSTGNTRTWLFCLLAGLVVALTTTSFDKGLPDKAEVVRIAGIVILTVIGLRKGLTLKG